MGRRLLVVEDTFVNKGRGPVLVPGILAEVDERFRVGDPIEPRKPNGSAIATRIGGLELLCPNPRGDAVLMLKELAKTDVPIGTEVWSVGGAEAGMEHSTAR